MKDLTTRIFLASICGVFILGCLVFVPYAGIQNDEALFANPIYQNSFEFKIRFQHHNLPLMIMSYIGTLKSLIYWLIWKIFPPGLYSLRVPVILVGAITLLLFYHFVRRVSSPRTAWLAVALLATDPSFLLTGEFDWGPVALQHLLLVTACFLVVRFSQDGGQGHGYRDLGLAGACLGLAVWDKAIFLWALAGLAVAALVVCRSEVRQLVRWPAVRIGAAGLVLGALPFAIYNIKRPNVTLASNARLEVPDWHAKGLQVRSALDGSGLLGYLVADEPGPVEQAATSRKGSAAAWIAAWIHDHLGEHRQGGMYYASLVCLALVPLWWRSRVAWFSIVFSATTWLLMAITRDGGTATHHVVLLWPFPQLFVATVLSCVRWRAVSIAAVAILCGLNLLVLNQYLWQFEQYGAGASFTDALIRLSGDLSAYESNTIYVLDWGIQNSIAVSHRGRLHLEGADGPFETDMPDAILTRFRGQMFDDPNGVFIRHVAGREYFQGVRERFDRDVEAAGRRERMLETVADSHGRPVFEILRLADASR